MAITINFNRPKLQPTTTEAVPVTATLVEDTTNNLYVVDVKYTITKDDASTATKVLKRIKITPVLAGTTMRLDFQELTFPPTAPDSPTDAQASTTSPVTRGTPVIDLDAFLTAIGDARKNT
jgi:hypothetical protein